MKNRKENVDIKSRYLYNEVVIINNIFGGVRDMKKKIGLVPKLIMGIAAGIILGSFAPEAVVRVLVTASTLFSAFLKFVIPFIIIGFVTAGIADLATGAGKLLGITTGIAYGSTIVAGAIAFLVASNVFPAFIDASVASQIGDPEAGML